jgi:hypothetical protein
MLWNKKLSIYSQFHIIISQGIYKINISVFFWYKSFKVTYFGPYPGFSSTQILTTPEDVNKAYSMVAWGAREVRRVLYKICDL